MRYKIDYEKRIKELLESQNKKYTYYIETMGCALNENDSMKYAGILEEMSFSKAQDIKDANVRHKRIATIEWCKKINQLNPEDRMNREWEYLLLSEDNFYGYCSSNATFMDIARLSGVSLSALTGNLFA